MRRAEVFESGLEHRALVVGLVGRVGVIKWERMVG
jgi:hypothetical protein